MKTFLLLLMTAATASAQTLAGGMLVGAGLGSSATPAAAWQLITPPTFVATNGGIPFLGLDGNFYFAQVTGTPGSGTGVFTVLQIPMNQTTGVLGTPIDISGTGLPNNRALALGFTMGMMPDGTLIIPTEGATGGAAQPYYWNRSTGSPVWATFTGFTPYAAAPSSSSIYTMNNADDGRTCFSAAWNGDIWCNASANSKTVSKVVANAYFYSGNGTGTTSTCASGVTGLGGGGGAGTGCSGGLYQTALWDLGDGAGLMHWHCGEGGLSAVNTSLTTANLQTYGTFPGGYTSNCTALARSATTILFVRQGGTTQWLTAINVATKVVTQYNSPIPRTSTSLPPTPDSNKPGHTLMWLSGTTFVSNARNSNTLATTIVLSTDDGATWTDMMTLGTVPTQCNASNLAQLASANAHWIVTRNNSNNYCLYGPIAFCFIWFGQIATAARRKIRTTLGR